MESLIPYIYAVIIVRGKSGYNSKIINKSFFLKFFVTLFFAYTNNKKTIKLVPPNKIFGINGFINAK